MPSLDLALCHRMIGLAADVAHTPILEPIGKLCGDIGWPVIAEQTRTLIDWKAVEAGCLQRHVQRCGHVRCRHGWAELPGHNIAREVVGHGGEVVPAPAGNLQVCEVGLPEL